MQFVLMGVGLIVDLIGMGLKEKGLKWMGTTVFAIGFLWLIATWW